MALERVTSSHEKTLSTYSRQLFHSFRGAWYRYFTSNETVRYRFIPGKIVCRSTVVSVVDTSVVCMEKRHDTQFPVGLIFSLTVVFWSVTSCKEKTPT